METSRSGAETATLAAPSALEPGQVEVEQRRRRPREVVARYGLLMGLALLVLIFGILEPEAFLAVDNLTAAATIAAPLLVLSVGLTVPLAMGEFDLSITSGTQLWAAILMVLISERGMSWGLALPVAVLVGAISGTVIGLIVVRSKVNAFIVTLGVGTVLAGLEFAVAEGQTIYENVPPAYSKLGSEDFLGVPIAVLVALAFTLVIWLLTERTVTGRRMRSIGGNPEAARLCGVRVDVLRTVGFVIAGVSGVFAALLITAQASSYYPNSATALLLPAYAACFLGTTVLRSNIFDVVGTLIGVAFLATIQNGLLIVGVPSWTAQVTQGALLVVAVVASKLVAGPSK